MIWTVGLESLREKIPMSRTMLSMLLRSCFMVGNLVRVRIVDF